MVLWQLLASLQSGDVWPTATSLIPVAPRDASDRSPRRPRRRSSLLASSCSRVWIAPREPAGRERCRAKETPSPCRRRISPAANRAAHSSSWLPPQRHPAARRLPHGGSAVARSEPQRPAVHHSAHDRHSLPHEKGHGRGRSARCLEEVRSLSIPQLPVETHRPVSWLPSPLFIHCPAAYPSRHILHKTGNPGHPFPRPHALTARVVAPASSGAQDAGRLPSQRACREL